MKNDNHSLRDPIAYRIIYTPHYRTGNRWVVYPSYDYSHGLVDALEGVTDSFCSMEFFVRREQYYWPVLKLKDKFNLKPATVFEFGRLNIEGVTLSKRKIVPLIESGLLTGFDDPRLYTIRGLRRRGFTPEILKRIVSHAGMSRTPSTISKSIIDFELRSMLDKVSERVFAVMDPIKVLFKPDTSIFGLKECKHPNHPNDSSNKEEHVTYLGRSIYIERNDFREIDSPDYYRLAPGKTIRLRYADFIKYVNHENLDSGLCITVEDVVPEKPKKIKGVIHWVSCDESASHRVVIEMCDPLYKNDGEIIDTSHIKIVHGYVERYVVDRLLKCNNPTELTFQFERLGYFKFDRYDESLIGGNSNKIPVFIRVIDLTDRYNS